ncbi:hypothetical protein SH661x_001144 [Planctomicrobium sp. SH661]|uniref:hypothetical protein n=1 Tax=Planctomicrobium sp. SH661 TaxID=3448124 RepID=UPI003F5B226E
MAGRVDPVESFLKENGPTVSADLANGLVAMGVAGNAPAARKMMQRATCRTIQSTDPVRFDKSYLYYLESHKGKLYAQAVRKLLPSKPSFHRIYKTILSNKGWITEGQIGKASGCLPKASKSTAGGRLPLEAVVDQLMKLKLIEKVAGEDELFRIGMQFGSVGLSRPAFRRKLELEQRLLVMLRDWVRNCFLIAYDKHSMRKAETCATGFNDTLWDLHGPTYFGPFSEFKPLRRSVQSGSFIAAEILGFRPFSSVDAEATRERVEGIGHRWKSISLVPLVVAPAYSKEAWKMLREAGVIAATFKDVFGPNIDELIRRFSMAIEAGEPTEENLCNIEKALAITHGTVIDEGLLGNLKGALFELLVAMGFRASGFDTTLQKKIRGLPGILWVRLFESGGSVVSFGSCCS